MPNIPVRLAQEPIRVGGINVTATAQEFGADVGAATEGLGSAIAGLGSAFTGVGERLAAKGRSDTADTDRLAVANAFADPANSYDTTYNDTVTGYDPASGTPLPNVVGDNYKTWVDERVAAFPGSAKAKDAFRLKLLGDAPAYIHAAATTAANDKAAASVNASEAGLNGVINDVRSNGANAAEAPSYDPTTGKVRPGGSRYDIALKKGEDLLDAQIGFDAAAKDKAKIAFRSNLATANFEALATAAKTPEEIAALRVAAGSTQWTSQFTDNAHAAVLSMLDTRENQIGAQGKAQLTADLNEFEAVAKAHKPPTEELYQRVRIGISGGTPDEQRRFADAQIQVETDKAYRGKPAWMIQAGKDNHTNETYNNTTAAPFLLSRLNKGHPAYYIKNMRPELQGRLAKFIQSAPPGIRENITIVSGARDTHDQGRVRVQHGLPYYGRGTATVGGNPRPGELGYGSKHLQGMAVDLGWKGGKWSSMPVAAQQWLVANAHAFGLRQLPGDPTHFDMVEARGGTYNGDANGTVYGAGVTGADGFGTAPPGVRTSIERVATGPIPANILAGVWVTESGGVLHPPDSKSKVATARGPFQFTDATWKDYGQGGDVQDFDQAAAAANRYLTALYNKYGDMRTALQAYNWGPGNMDNYLAHPELGGMPQETRDYADKVMGHANGGALDRADSPGNSAPGFTGADVARSKAFDELLNDQKQRITANSAEYFSTDGGIAMSPITQVSTVQDFMDRAEQVAQGSELFNVTPADVKPFTTSEAATLSTLLASTDQTGKAQLMAKISSMGETMAGYAYKQLGKDNPVFGFAGDRYLKGQHDTATNILNGDGLLAGEGGKDIVKGWGAGMPGGPGSAAEEMFNATLGASLGAFGPGVRDTTLKAVNALYAQATRFMPPGTPLDPELYKAKIAEATGMVPVDIHGDGEVSLLKKEVPVESVQTFIREGHVDDWVEMGRVPNQPPVDAKGNVIPAETLAAEAHLFPYDDKGGYLVTLSDHQPVAINLGDPRDPTRRLPYILQLDPQRLSAKVDELTRTPAPPTTVEDQRALKEKALTTFVPTTSPAQQLVTEGPGAVARRILGRPATAEEIAAHNAGTAGLPQPAPELPPVDSIDVPAAITSAGKRVFGRSATPAEIAARKAGTPTPLTPGAVPTLNPQGYSEKEAKANYLATYKSALERAGFEGKELDDALKAEEAKGRWKQ